MQSYADLIPTGPDVPTVVKAVVLARWLAVTTKTLRQWAADGILPEPIILTDRTHVYIVAKVRRALLLLEEQVVSAIPRTSGQFHEGYNSYPDDET